MGLEMCPQRNTVFVKIKLQLLPAGCFSLFILRVGQKNRVVLLARGSDHDQYEEVERLLPNGSGKE